MTDSDSDSDSDRQEAETETETDRDGHGDSDADKMERGAAGRYDVAPFEEAGIAVADLAPALAPDGGVTFQVPAAPRRMLRFGGMRQPRRPLGRPT